MNTETNKAIVKKISESHVTVAINGESKNLTWDALNRAANYSPHTWGGQNDKELADFYSGLRKQARAMASKIRTVKITVGTSTGGATSPCRSPTSDSLKAMPGDSASR